MFRKVLLASLIAGTITLVAPTSLFAVDAPPATPAAEPARPHPLDRIRNILERLDLTADQKAQVKTILEDAREKIKPILEADKGDREKLRQDVTPILKDTHEKVKALLTEEQKKKFHELMMERREKEGAATQK